MGCQLLQWHIPVCGRDYLLQYDGRNVRAVYDIKRDWLLTSNIMGKVPEEEQMLRNLKAIIQQYMERMIEDRIVP